MAEPLKHVLNAQVVRDIAAGIGDVCPDFDKTAFVAASCEGLDALGLGARAAHIADALQAGLPQPFPAAAGVLMATLGPESEPEGSGLYTLRYWPHSCFVQKYGLQDFDVSMRFQHALTKRFSAEFSIRPYLVAYPERTLAQLREWASDPCVHVRRLVSEGTRPRLPWAPQLRAFRRDPEPVIGLLELLKDDTERYVQRSVANNLNDIAKDHPERVVNICRRWQTNAPVGRQWIVRHALRSLVKRGTRGALEILGVAARPDVEIFGVRSQPERIEPGDTLRFAFGIRSTGRSTQDLLVDFAVHFVKANGSTRPKVFKLRKIALPASGSQMLEGTVSFQDMTTRRHYPGQHAIDVLINGVAFPLLKFDVLPG